MVNNLVVAAAGGRKGGRVGNEAGTLVLQLVVSRLLLVLLMVLLMHGTLRPGRRGLRRTGTVAEGRSRGTS